MKSFFLVALVLATIQTASAGFDVKAWLAKRERLNAEVIRLRTAYTNCVANLEVPAEDVYVSLETFPDGTVKMSANAKKAQFFPDSELVWAKDIVIRKFRTDGSVDVQIDAETCVVDRKTKSGWSDGNTKVVQGKSVFTGKYVYFSTPEGYVKVGKDTDLSSEDIKATGGGR